MLTVYKINTTLQLAQCTIAHIKSSICHVQCGNFLLSIVRLVELNPFVPTLAVTLN